MVAPANDNPIRVIIIDDHPVALAGIRVGLKRFHDVQLVAEALDGTTGLEQIARLKPDVAVIDVLLPDLDGLEVTARARELSPATRLIITSGDLSIATMSRASQLGVAGFFHKSGAVERLALLIRSVHCSETEGEGTETLAVPATAEGLESLTLNEHDLLMQLANGASLKNAAAHLGINFQSAERLQLALMRKLDVQTRVDLVRRAVEEKLVRDPL
jgi:DNA-binding NarL/FixJ family response regulator